MTKSINKLCGIATILSLICITSSSSAKVKFRIESPSEELISQDNESDRYDRLEVFVNGVFCSKKDIWYKVEPRKTGLDVIVVKNEDSIGDCDTIYAKLRDKLEYRFVFNVCSFYEIVPGKGKVGSHGYIRIISEDRDSINWYFTTSMTMVYDSLIRTQDTTKYFEVFFSAYCPYTPTGFYFCNSDVDNQPVFYPGDLCYGKVIWFSGTEHYSLIYNYRNREMRLVFEGYSIE